MFRNKRLFIAMLVIPGLIAVVMGARNLEPEPANSRSENTAPIRADVLSLSASGAVPTAQTPATSGEVELVTLTPRGFEPDELSRPAGKFLLGINNRSGLPELTFSIIRENGSAHATKRMTRQKVWREVVDLQPGHYLLRVLNHPEWKCPITIVRGR